MAESRGNLRFGGLVILAALAVGTCGIAPGTDAVTSRTTAAHPNQPCPPAQPPKRQFRGAWIATVLNINWPSKPGLGVDDQKTELVSLLDEATKLGLNAVILQVRPTADAFYRSDYAPWSQYLTGTQGQDPGYDPLAFAVAETHQRNLELHAWMNPYRVSMAADREKLAADNPARQHPDWVVAYGGKLYFDPGIPAARELVEKSVVEVALKYDVDGIHFDDYFYPYPVGAQRFPDDATYQRYGAGTGLSLADWRRQNVNSLIDHVHSGIHRARPWVKFGVSPFGVWRNHSSDPTGSATTAGAEDYDTLYADLRTWIRSGWLDYVAPQVYWSQHFAPAAFSVLVPWWANEVRGHPAALYIGLADYKVGTAANNDPAWKDPEEIQNQVHFDYGVAEVAGEVHYNLGSVIANPLGLADRLRAQVYLHPALVPVMPWLAGSAPHPPSRVEVRPGPAGVVLTWTRGQDREPPAYYAIYRFEGAGNHSGCDFEDSRHLLATVRRAGTDGRQTWTDATAAAGGSYAYYVTSVDRLHHESEPRHGRQARA